MKQREKSLKKKQKNEERLSDLWDNIKPSSKPVIELPEGEGRDQEKYLKK